MNLRKSNIPLKSTFTRTMKELTSAVVNHLDAKYFEDFNFYFAKYVNEIVGGVHSPQEITYKDHLVLDTREEVLRRYYNTQESYVRLSNYAGYYAELEDYLVPHTELHTQRKMLFKRRKRKYKLKSRRFDVSRINQSLNRKKRRRAMLERLDKRTVYLEDINISNATSVAHDMSSFKLDNDYRLEYIRGLDFNDVHDIYNPVYSSEEDNLQMRPTVTTICIDQKVTESEIFDPYLEDSIITRITELEKANKSGIYQLGAFSGSFSVYEVETVDMLKSQRGDANSNQITYFKKDFKKRRSEPELDITRNEVRSASIKDKIENRQCERSEEINKKPATRNTTLKDSLKNENDMDTLPHITLGSQNNIVNNMLNFTLKNQKTITYDDRIFLTNVDDNRKSKPKPQLFKRNDSLRKRSHNKKVAMLQLKGSVQRKEPLKSFKDIGINEKSDKFKLESSPCHPNNFHNYLAIGGQNDKSRKSSQGLSTGINSAFKLNMKNKHLLAVNKTKTDDAETKPTLSLSNYVKSLLTKSKSGSGTNTLKSFRNNEFLSKVHNHKKDPNISQTSKGILKTIKDESRPKNKIKEATSVKRTVASNSIKRNACNEKILPERFYDNQYNSSSKNRNDSVDDQLDEYNYYKSVKNRSKKTIPAGKQKKKSVASKGSIVNNRKNTSQSNSRSISTQRQLMMAINSTLKKVK